MRFKVNPNRMELVKLKRRLELARRGHKLLKDKFEGLREAFLKEVGRVTRERQAIEQIWLKVYQEQILLRAQLSAGALEQLFPPGLAALALRSKIKSLFGVQLTTYEVAERPDQADHSFLEIPAQGTDLMKRRADLLERLLVLAQDEKSLWLLAAEIEKTRRRVNALEYILVPALTETIRYIELKLDQMERFNIAALMKMKAMVASYKEGAAAGA